MGRIVLPFALASIEHREQGFFRYRDGIRLFGIRRIIMFLNDVFLWGSLYFRMLGDIYSSVSP